MGHALEKCFNKWGILRKPARLVFQMVCTTWTEAKNVTLQVWQQHLRTVLLWINLLGEQIVLQSLSGVRCKVQNTGKWTWLMTLTSWSSRCCSYTATDIRVNLNLSLLRWHKLQSHLVLQCRLSTGHAISTVFQFYFFFLDHSCLFSWNKQLILFCIMPLRDTSQLA